MQPRFFAVVGVICALAYFAGVPQLHPMDRSFQLARKVGLADSILEKARQRSRPALHLEHTDIARWSWIGGAPLVAPDFVWPQWESTPMSFLAQIDLEEVAATLKQPWLPGHGQLYFFHVACDPEQGDEPTQRGSWRVMYSDAERSSLSSPSIPAHLRAFPRTYVRFRAIDSLPSEERLSDGAEISGEELEVLLRAENLTFAGQPRHQMFGYPIPEQNDNMELESQLASQGLTIGASKDAGFKQAEHDAPQWKLLLQLDTDDDLNMMWEDGGLLYFWVRETDASQGNFDNDRYGIGCRG
jgi:uncharacterized protein YwqG